MAAINRRLNIVDEVTTADGVTLYVHSVPIRAEIWDQHYLVLTKTLNDIYERGMAPGMASRIALNVLRDTARSISEETLERVDGLLLPEIWRLTNVLVPQPGAGWTMLPFEKVVADKLIDDEDERTIRNHIVFFTAASWVHTRKELDQMIYPMMRSDTFGAQIVSSSCTDFMRSLQTSTPAATTGETATPSSMPS